MQVAYAKHPLRKHTQKENKKGRAKREILADIYRGFRIETTIIGDLDVLVEEFDANSDKISTNFDDLFVEDFDRKLDNILTSFDDFEALAKKNEGP